MSSLQKAQLFCQYKMIIQAYFYHRQNSDRRAQEQQHSAGNSEGTEPPCGAGATSHASHSSLLSTPNTCDLLTLLFGRKKE